MGHHILEDISVPFNAKVKTPPSVDTGLPDVAGLVVFFGP